MKSNKFRLPILILVLVLVLGLGYVFFFNKDKNTPTPTNTQEKVDTTAKTDVQTPTTSQPSSETPAQSQPSVSTALKGTYSDYSADTLSSVKGKRILFFHAPWCPQCRQLEASIKSGEIPDGVSIVKVDYDSNQKLRQKYGVTIQTTMVLIGDNEESIKKFVAYDKPSLDSVKENLL